MVLVGKRLAVAVGMVACKDLADMVELLQEMERLKPLHSMGISATCAWARALPLNFGVVLGQLYAVVLTATVT